MKKDKITISYILLTIALLILTAVYFADLDYKEMNSKIEKGSEKVINRGKHYSDKLYTMVSSEWHELNNVEDNNSLTTNSSKLNDLNRQKKQKKPLTFSATPVVKVSDLSEVVKTTKKKEISTDSNSSSVKKIGLFIDKNSKETK